MPCMSCTECCCNMFFHVAWRNNAIPQKMAQSCSTNTPVADSPRREKGSVTPRQCWMRARQANLYTVRCHARLFCHRSNNSLPAAARTQLAAMKRALSDQLLSHRMSPARRYHACHCGESCRSSLTRSLRSICLCLF